MRSLTGYLLASLLLPLAASAGQTDDWLSRMDTALRTTDYQGTLIYMDGERMDMMRIYHSAANDTERLVTLSGPHREVIREGRTVTCIGLGRPATIYDGAGLAALRPVVRAVQNGQSSFYSLRLADQERVAGREAQVLEVRAGDAYRYGYRLWLDLESAFPLRVSLLDREGRSLEDLAFTDIQLGLAPSSSDLEPGSEQALRRVSLPAAIQNETPAPAAALLAPASLPAGFTVRSHAKNDHGEQHWVFSDGLASVSVYVKPAPTDSSRESVSRSGSVHAKLIQAHGQRIYAIGRVPAETVDHLARGLADPGLAAQND